MHFLIYNISWPLSPLTSPSHLSGISTCPSPHFHVSLFSVPVIPIRDAQMCIGVGHPPAHRQPTSGHTLEEDPTYPYQSSSAKSTLPREGIHEPLSSSCWVADWHDLGHVLSGSPHAVVHEFEGNSQVMSRRQHFAYCDSFRLLCSFIRPLQLCSVGVGCRNIDFRTEHSIVTILNALTI